MIPHSRLEFAAQQRRRKSFPMLYHSSLPGVPSLRSDVERLTRLTFRLTHIRQISWLAPHLIALSWARSPDDAEWDLEIQQRPNSVTGTRKHTKVGIDKTYIQVHFSCFL